MKKLALSALALTAATSAFADCGPGAKGFNASFWAPNNQVVSADQDVKGVRLNVFYGENKNVTGWDIGFANSVTGDMNGLQWLPFLPTIYNHVGGKLNGVQFAIVNQYGSEVNGWTSGLVNYSTAKETEFNGLNTGFVNWGSSTDIYGVQLGFVNRARHVSGVQLGLVNLSEHLVGVQIGLWNMVLDRSWGDIGHKGLGRGFPFINLGW